jgi:hypothetical protein
VIDAPPLAAARRHRVFLLSPADCSGTRALQLHRETADHALAHRLRDEEGAPLGDVFSYVSSLYFRGKLAYARAFARPPQGSAGVHVITPCDGLRPPEVRVSLRDLQRFGRVPIALDERRYTRPLVRDLRALAPLWAETDVVLLGSVASGKYAELLAPLLGSRLLFPSEFAGRGDMSRGGLMLRCVAEGRELAYVPVMTAERHGPRPPRLAPLPRRGAARES